MLEADAKYRDMAITHLEKMPISYLKELQPVINWLADLKEHKCPEPEKARIETAVQEGTSTPEKKKKPRVTRKDM